MMRAPLIWLMLAVATAPARTSLPAFTRPQVELATPNSDGLVLLTLDTETAVPPVLVTVTLVGALMTPTAWLPKLTLVFIDSTPGLLPEVPVPLAAMNSSGMVRVLPATSARSA